MKKIKKLLENVMYDDASTKTSKPTKSSLKIEDGCGFSKEANKHLIAFADFCKIGLDLPDLPPIQIISKRIDGMTTGAYDPDTHTIYVLGLKRALPDIMLTLAHELTHYRQRLQDKIKSSKRDWALEGEADAEAGKMVYTYAHDTEDNMKIYDV
jgi:hypothetical protein